MSYLIYYDPATETWETLDSPFKFNGPLCTALEGDLTNKDVVKNTTEKETCCADDFSKLQRWLCRAPVDTTVRVNTLRSTVRNAEQLLQQHLDKVKLDAWTVSGHPELPDALVIRSNADAPTPSLRPALKEVVVDAACGVAVLRGANVYAPGILAAPAAMKAGDDVQVVVDLEGKCRRGSLKPFGEKKLFVGLGKAVLGRSEIFTVQNPRGLAVEITDSFYKCPSIGSLFNDVIFLQNFPSIVCSHVLNPKPGELILDMCAAPGGKCTHLATLMKNQGKIIALDKSANKIATLRANVNRCGVTCVSAYAFDATKAVDFSSAKISDAVENPPYPPETFDRVLLDAPCSALGQRPQLNNRTSVSQLQSYPALQQKLMKNAVALLKKGGTLVYSTCTLTTAENEKIVHWTLSTFGNMMLEKQEIHVGGYGRPGSELTPDELQKVQRFEC